MNYNFFAAERAEQQAEYRGENNTIVVIPWHSQCFRVFRGRFVNGL